MKDKGLIGNFLCRLREKEKGGREDGYEIKLTKCRNESTNSPRNFFIDKLQRCGRRSNRKINRFRPISNSSNSSKNVAFHELPSHQSPSPGISNFRLTIICEFHCVSCSHFASKNYYICCGISFRKQSFVFFERSCKFHLKEEVIMLLSLWPKNTMIMKNIKFTSRLI